MNKGHRIDNIAPGSIAEELGLENGDILVSINDTEVQDVLDYRFLCKEEFLNVLIRRGDEEAVFEVEKDFDEDLGLIFDDGLMDGYHSCCNKCIFCFIDQMPKGMRDTLYFKDDDERLSFLQGNYITLTNLSDDHLERIIRYRLSPINISIQTTNPELRCMMLGNKFAGSSLSKMDKLFEAGIIMNAQVVLCEGINDGEELEKTISDLSRYAPLLESVSIVPVGLTKHRDGLYPLKPVTKENARRVVELVEKWQEKMMETCDLHFVHASDEFYLMLDRDMPSEETYDGYLQYENGVGMLRLLEEEFIDELSRLDETIPGSNFELDNNHVIIATGMLASPMLTKLTNMLKDRFPSLDIEVVSVSNEFFGPGVTVAGLLTGSDLINALQGKAYGRRLLITNNMLRSGEEVFLDDITVSELSEKLGAKVIPVPNEGKALISAILGQNYHENTYNSYEI